MTLIGTMSVQVRTLKFESLNYLVHPLAIQLPLPVTYTSARMLESVPSSSSMVGATDAATDPLIMPTHLPPSNAKSVNHWKRSVC